ncbi:MAG: hypothetical protein ABSC06_11060 [Rhodopila sp.]|jgi:hypothetical protein
MTKSGEVKSAFPPLLPPGRHVMTADRLEHLTVTRFQSSVMRPIIFAEFRRLLNEMATFGLVGELWVDGSFMTEKPEPDDIDLSFGFNPEHLDQQTPEARAFVLTNLNGGKAYSPLLDTYMCFMFPVGDPRQAASSEDYWAEKWLVGWDDRLKGFAVVKLGESDVWFNLYAH